MSSKLSLLVLLAVALPIASAFAPHAPPANVHAMPAGSPHAAGASAAAVNNLVYGGGRVLASPKVFITYWGWGQIGDPSGEAPYLEAFFRGIGGTPWANIQTQYYGTGQGNIQNPANQLKGVWHDDSLLPPPIADADASTVNVYITQEAIKSEAHFGGYVPDALYIIALPHGDDIDYGGGYCAYHSDVDDGAGHNIAFANLPYIPDSDLLFARTPVASGGLTCGNYLVNGYPGGPLDGVSIVAGHEYAEAVTDAQPNTGWSASDGENGDKCAWISTGPARMQNIHLSTGDFAVQSLWSNAASGCVMAYP